MYAVKISIHLMQSENILDQRQRIRNTKTIKALTLTNITNITLQVLVRKFMLIGISKLGIILLFIVPDVSNDRETLAQFLVLAPI
jgi:hypothetical protein